MHHFGTWHGSIIWHSLSKQWWRKPSFSDETHLLCSVQWDGQCQSAGRCQGHGTKRWVFSRRDNPPCFWVPEASDAGFDLCPLGSARGVFMPEADASTFFKSRGRRSTRHQAELHGEGLSWSLWRWCGGVGVWFGLWSFLQCESWVDAGLCSRPVCAACVMCGVCVCVCLCVEFVVGPWERFCSVAIRFQFWKPTQTWILARWLSVMVDAPLALSLSLAQTGWYTGSLDAYFCAGFAATEPLAQTVIAGSLIEDKYTQ